MAIRKILLPSAYQQVEYLQSTGSAYIDTGLTGNENTKIVVDMMCVSGGGQSIGFFATNRSITLQFTNATGPSRFGTYSFVYTDWTAGERDVYEIDASGYKKNGVYIAQNTAPQSFETDNLYLFKCNGSTTTGSFRIYDYKIYSNGVLVQHLIPCYRKVDDVIGMYDLVSGAFYTNAGSGTFTKGNDYVPQVKHILKNIPLLPTGYQQVEYIESTGTQYLDLGYYPNQNTKVETTINILSHNGSVINYLFGAYDSSRSFAIYYSYNLLDWGVMCGGVDRNTSVAYQSNVKQKLEFDKDYLSINGTNVYNVGSTSTFTSTRTMYLFWGNGTSRLKSISRIYDFKIYENGNIVMNLIPALDPNGVPCMYDTVSKQPFYNAGTGTFVVGSNVSTMKRIIKKYKGTSLYFYDVPSIYQRVEYLESSGTQYIDTGYYATTTSGINIDYAYTASGNAGLCGIFQSRVPRTDTLFITTLSGQTSTVMYLISRGGELTNNVVPTLGTKYNGKINYLNNGKLIIDNTKTGNDGSNGVVSSRTIKLFCRDNGGNLAYTNARIYMCKISEGENIVRNFIPCYRKSDNVAGMYDVISGQFFTNSGTGTFNFG